MIAHTTSRDATVGALARDREVRLELGGLHGMWTMRARRPWRGGAPVGVRR